MRPSRVRIDPGKDAMMKEVYNCVRDLSCCHLRTRIGVFSFCCTVSSSGALPQHRWTADFYCVDQSVSKTFSYVCDTSRVFI